MQQGKTQEYIHTEEVHNLKSPGEIAPVLYGLIQPKSVVDVGCGVGTFLYSFKKLGVTEVLGIDGPWVNKELLEKYIKPEEFKDLDLNKPFNLDHRYDLAICLEVAEHLSEESSELFVKNLTSLSDVILFSAAIPNQGGQNHINEQWPGYWERIFKKHGYEFKDVLRPVFWNNPEVYWWYKQNMFLVTKKGYELDTSAIQKHFLSERYDYVHPDNFMYHTELLKAIVNGDYTLKGYLSFLLKGIKKKVGLK